MDAETRTQVAIDCARKILMKALDSPFTMALITINEMDPDAVEDQVERILCYLEKTRPRKAEEAEG